MTLGGTRIESKRAIKYLGMIIDVRLNFKEHVKYIGEKASVTSIMPYACPIWSEGLSVRTTMRILFSVYHLSAIKGISSIRTVSDEAVLEEMRIYLRQLECPGQITTKKAEDEEGTL